MFCFYVKDKIIHGYYISYLDDLLDEDINLIKSICKGNGTILTSFNRRNYNEYGPILSWKSPWCSNMLSILKRIGVNNLIRIEKTDIYHNSHEYKYDRLTEQYYPEGIMEFPKSEIQIRDFEIINMFDLEEYNEKNALSFDKQDIDYYRNIYTTLTEVELFDLAQSNSEHSRHWFFNGQLFIDNNPLNKTLFNMVKEPYKKNKRNSLVAFSDNSSAISGFKTKYLAPFYPHTISEYKLTDRTIHFTCTAETHNFPTGYEPFSGASTGVGGRIRDTQSIGKGGYVVAGIAGYCVGNLFLENYNLQWENTDTNQLDLPFAPASKILISASNGASDYGNKFGEPLVLGFVRTYGHQDDNKHIEWCKPIMFSAGIGQVEQDNLFKDKPKIGNLIVRVGGPVYKIGVGGGAASSRNQDSSNQEHDMNAIQRGDPEMQNKMNRVIRSCMEMGKDNPILSIHDQGAGGMGNVTKEIVYPEGGYINLDKIELGDKTLSLTEIWISEHQEQNTMLISNKKKYILDQLSEREGVSVSYVGSVSGDKNIKLINNHNSKRHPVDLKLSPILDNILQKKYYLVKPNIKLNEYHYDNRYSCFELINRIFRLVSVGSKKFLVNKVDRSVTGLVAQQQTIGEYQLPLSNYAILAQTHFGNTGVVTSIGEQPIKGLNSPDSMARMCVGEMLTNLVFAKIINFEDIKCSANWMWPNSEKGEKYRLYTALKALVESMKILGIAIDGGKDSLSMVTKTKNKTIVSPGTLVLTSYAPTKNVYSKVTPNIKHCNSLLYFIDLGFNKCRMGGSALSQILSKPNLEVPDVEHPLKLRHIFEIIQNLMGTNVIISGHDRSDGGLITTICEMCFAGGVGCNLSIYNKYFSWDRFLFNEELGLVIEIKEQYESLFRSYFEPIVPTYKLGKTTGNNNIKIVYNNQEILNYKMTKLRDIWERTSFQLEKKQTNIKCVISEIENSKLLQTVPWKVNNCRNYMAKLPREQKGDFKVAILREEGSNGDREMASAFYMAGFTVIDICMNDLVKATEDPLQELNGIAFVGGFSFSDVGGAGRGWEHCIKYNKKIKLWFDEFYKRKDTFSLGICNGCQLMSNLGWIPETKFIQNDSCRFESRFSIVKIYDSSSIFLKGLQNCNLGIWIAHGEGKCITSQSLENCPMRYVDIYDKDTELYPYNPNGSKNGVTAVCSENGRHLAMMPHPERSFIKWQLPHHPIYLPSIKYDDDVYLTPWFLIFQNAYLWCSSF